MADDILEDGGQATTDTGVNANPTGTATGTVGGGEEAAGASVVKPEIKGETKPDDVVPESYDLKIPDGSLLKTDYIEEIKAEAKELGLTNSEAQEYLESQHRAVSTYHETLFRDYETEKSRWAKQSESDKEFGGDGFKQNVELANRALKRYDKSGVFSEMLNKSGFGNHPEVLRIFVRIGKDMSEDTMIHARAHDNQKKNIEDILYSSKEG